ncbi:MAG: hypothetical protein LBI59_10355 [Candidatus Accumulibacter sp.]|nr:hypothetical protein [Accumulibacter sp.]
MKKLMAADKATIARLEERLKKAKSREECQRIQCVLMRMTQGMRAKEVAQQVGWSVATVHIFQSRWAREGDEVFEVGKRGGRRREYLSREEEMSFLEPFFEQAKAGHRIATKEIWRAYEERVGRPVVASTVYRLLARSGWKKTRPQIRNPQT